MHIVDSATIPGHQSAEGPVVRPLLRGDAVAVLHVTLPAGAAMPEHDHGPSNVILLPRSGTVRLRHDGQDHDLSLHTVTHIAIGERVGLANHGTQPAELIVVVHPPDFADRFAAAP